jgi:hypothetical protein
MKYLPVMSILGAPIEMKKFVKKGKRLGWRRRGKNNEQYTQSWKLAHSVQLIDAFHIHTYGPAPAEWIDYSNFPPISLLLPPLLPRYSSPPISPLSTFKIPHQDT